MPDARAPIKLDFTTGLDKLPPRPKRDETTTQASVSAGREVGFSDRAVSDHLPSQHPKLDGRSLRSRGANIQLNLKVTAAEKETILREAALLIQDPGSQISNIGEFVVYAVELYRAKKGDRA